MRHGETYAPRLDSPMAGPEEDPALPLTEHGRRRLLAVASALAEAKLEAVYASPYRRCQETAHIVADPLGLPVGTLEPLSELPIHPPPGGTLRDIARRYLELRRQLASTPPGEVVLDDGLDLASRLAAARAALREALARHRHRVLVVAHGGLNRLLLAGWLGMPPDRFLSLDQDFGCVNVVDFARRGWPWVRAVNVTLDDPLKAEGVPASMESRGGSS